MWRGFHGVPHKSLPHLHIYIKRIFSASPDFMAEPHDNPVNTRRRSNVVVILTHRLRRWPTFTTTMGQRLVSQGDRAHFLCAGFTTLNPMKSHEKVDSLTHYSINEFSSHYLIIISHLLKYFSFHRNLHHGYNI